MFVTYDTSEAAMRYFNAKSRYALLAAMDLARHRDGETPIKKQDIAWRSGVPPKFLAQILLGLKRAALAGSTRGANGGYWLMRPPETITAQEIIDAVEHNGVGSREASNAPSPYDTAVDALFGRVDAAELAVLRGATLADLLAECKPDAEDI